MSTRLIAVVISMSVALSCNARTFEFVVVDEETRVPMTNVPVRIRLGILDSPEYVPYERQTDSNGVCVIRKKNVDKVSIRVVDDETRYFSSLSGLRGDEGSGDFVVTASVRRIINPIPMVVKNQGHSFTDVFALGDGVLRYDFFKGSYLPPVGTGVVSDVEFRRMPVEELGLACRTTIKGEIPTMRYREVMNVEFPGEGNGVVPVEVSTQSMLKLRTATTNGYERLYVCQRYDGAHHENICTWDDEKTLCFRIRTRRNDKGEIVEAYYGKIYGDISFDFTDTVRIGSPSFLYYLNPNSMDTNLEYDGRHNLRPGSNRNDYKP